MVPGDSNIENVIEGIDYSQQGTMTQPKEGLQQAADPITRAGGTAGEGGTTKTQGSGSFRGSWTHARASTQESEPGK